MLDHMNSVAPKDGTVIGITPAGPDHRALIGKRQASYRMADFVAIGAMTKEVSLCISWGASKFKTIEDATKARWWSPAPAQALARYLSVVLNDVLHTKFKVHHRLSGLAGDNRAIERGEVDGRCGWAGRASRAPGRTGSATRRSISCCSFALTKATNIPDAPW
jgi:hypothetical protein